MSREGRPLALTMGDPKGIGPEITAKAWAYFKNSENPITFACLSNLETAQKAAAELSLPAPQVISHPDEVKTVFKTALPVLPVLETTRAAQTTGSIARAVTLTLNDEMSGVVTNPISKHILYEAGFTHPGHTEYLGELTKNIAFDAPRGPVMMLSGGGLSVALVTIHMPLTGVATQISEDTIINAARVMDGALRRDFGLTAPRIAMTGLNPHAGENGALGKEENDIINPAASKLRAQGINITDAQPADTLFHAEAREGYDAVLAMYHDQGLIPVKTLDFHGGVNITLGLPIIRTSPDHGTAFNIAGQGIARPDSLIAAIKMAAMMATHRDNYAG